MGSRGVLPSPAERFRGRAAFRARGASPPCADQGGRQRHAAPGGHAGRGFSRVAPRFLFFALSRKGASPGREQGKRRGRKCSLCRCASTRRVKEKSLFKAPPPRSSAARVRCGSLLRMRQAGFRRLRGKRPGARRQSSSSLSGRSISSRTAAAGSAFS